MKSFFLFTWLPLGGAKNVSIHKIFTANQPHKHMNNKILMDYTWQNNNWKLIWKYYKRPDINPQMAISLLQYQSFVISVI